MIRIPVGLLLVLGGVFSILPGLGIWMLPLGLLLMASDVPFLRRPVGHLTMRGAKKWAAFGSGCFSVSAGERSFGVVVFDRPWPLRCILRPCDRSHGHRAK